MLPDYLSEWTTNKVRQSGVTVLPNARIKEAMIGEKGRLLLFFEDGTQLDVDHAVVAVGIEPNTELADVSCLEIDDKFKGYRVNAELEAR